MANNTLPEYLTNSRFYVELHLDGSQDTVDGTYKSCSGYNYSQDVIELAEVFPPRPGSTNPEGLVMRTKIPGNFKTTNFTLSRCMSSSMTLWQWIQDVQKGGWATKRRDGSLTIYTQDATPGARYTFFNAWPASYTFSEATVEGKELLVEDLEIVCEKFERTS
jgi:phage tail-like protein